MTVFHSFKRTVTEQGSVIDSYVSVSVKKGKIHIQESNKSIWRREQNNNKKAKGQILQSHLIMELLFSFSLKAHTQGIVSLPLMPQLKTSKDIHAASGLQSAHHSLSKCTLMENKCWTGVGQVNLSSGDVL